MRLYDPQTRLAISLEYDADGFPRVSIETRESGGYYDEQGRPTVEVWLNGEEIRSLFADSPQVTRLSILKDYLNQFDDDPVVLLLPSSDYPDAVILSNFFDALD